MKNIQKTFALILAAASTGALANTVHFDNHASYPIPIQYEKAYHPLNGPVRSLGQGSGVVAPHGELEITLPAKGYRHVGVVLMAVKSSLKGQWQKLPASAKQYDNNKVPGCWAVTTSAGPSKYLYLSRNQHTMICSNKAMEIPNE